MIRKYLLPVLAILGALFGIFIVFWTQKQTLPPPVLFPPPISPYTHSIAGAGLIETSSINRAIGTPFDEIVTELYVIEGDRVKVGDPLFKLDTRIFEAQATAAEASVKAAQIELQNSTKQYSFYQRLNDKRAVSEINANVYLNAMLSAEQTLAVAEANLAAAKVNIERSTIRAPVDGEVLQVNIYPGMLAAINPFFSNQSQNLAVSLGSLILMGTVDPLQVRVDIDEDDAWRYKKGSPATAYVRGNSKINFPIKFLRVEPYIIPKSSFTGETTERVDTRVLQVLYTFEKGDLPVYAGQVLDVYIEAEHTEPHPIK